ncbi:MAG TPA: DUF481 domain-containing protein [Bryobacteraceae bacterium]|jgi:hypothetical protein|nr:DUF481 domain-containing protein [Bryobacteraceae bacterium]
MRRYFCLLALPFCLLGQTTSSEPDVITFVNGDKMSGQMVGVTSTGLVFRAAMVGEVTVEWSKIRDLHSENGFGVIAAYARAGATGTAPPAFLPPAPATVAAGQTPARVAPAPAPAAPPPVAPPAVARATAPAPQPSTPAAPLQAAVPPPSAPVTPNRPEAAPAVPAPTPVSAANWHSWFGSHLFSGWQGNAAAGVAYVAATTSLISVTPSVNLLRTYPKAGGSWPLHARTYVNFMANYSRETQNGDVAYFDPTRRTIFIPGSFDETYTLHAEFVQDYFLFPRLFVQAGAIFDHNYAQSLDLLQSYGGGLGFVVYRTDRSELNLRAGVGYSRQDYNGYPGFDASVIAGRFYESYQHKFGNGMSFSEQGGMRPAWTDPRFLFGGGQLTFNMPVYRRLNLNVSSFDFWSRTPPPMLKKNIFQVALGVSYAF